ncbi:unnamed protein product [Moneuplotes crassus]|uniref:Major facilitator superfamily (MFS) profile domain-containing protein n=1 Tax=Euplotes crassus TaxID=5936 RepID=A0AAD1UDC4_EUPCR|nr:unnamed protein product [Moneuplotes crassus]
MKEYEDLDKIPESSGKNDNQQTMEMEEIDQKITLFDSYVLAMMMLNNVTSQCVSYLPAYASPGDEPFTNLELDLGLTKTQYGIMTGVTFALINGVFSLASGVIVDRLSRKYTMIVAGIFWGGLTIAQSFAINFVTIFIPRIVMEISVTACGSVAISIISDYFAPKYRARASSIYMLGLYIGVAGSSLALISVKNIGWRNTYRIIGGISLLVTFFTIFIYEPVRGSYNNAAKKNQLKELTKSVSKCSRLYKSAKTVLSSPLFLILCAASALRFFGGYASGFWQSKFFQNEFKEYQNEYSILSALTILILGVSGSYTGGYLSDKFSKTRPQLQAFMGGIGALIAFPFTVVAFTLSRNFWLSIFSNMAAYFPSEMWLGPTYALVQNMFPAEIVGTAIAILSFFGGIAGAISNILLGALGDALETEDNGRIAGYLLTVCFAISYIGCAPLFIIAGILYKRFIIKERKESIAEIKDSEIQEINKFSENSSN